MKKKMIGLIVVMLLRAASQLCYGQYFQGLYDVDTSQDWGWDIFLHADGNYFIKGTSINQSIYQWALTNMQVNADGSTILNKNILQLDNINLYLGYPGETKLLSDGGYISPLSAQLFYGSNSRSWAGIIKYNANGDTIFLKTYTDTPLYYDRMFCCAIMQNGGYIAGGQHGLYNASYPPGNLICTDSMGDTLWTHTYQHDTSQFVQINNIIPLPNGRIIAGAISTYIKNPGANEYYYDIPWYMLLDSLGNIIRDTLYTVGFQAGGNIYSDMNGGYITMGNLDIMLTSDPDDIQNFPSYIAHLDTNFHITWLTSFPYSDDSGHREEWLVKQLRDSSYIILGDKWTNGNPGNFGWAAKVNRNGEMIWSNSYQSDTINDSHFRDMIEKPDGSLVFVGESYNDTLPSWHQGEDMWLVGTDSNGCENGFCAPTAVPVIPTSAPSFTVFPNPSYGMLTATTTDGGTFYVYTIEGQQLGEYAISSGNTDIMLPVVLAPGIYIGIFKPDAGGKQSTVRLVYQP